jgi:hypothetical protein
VCSVTNMDQSAHEGSNENPEICSKQTKMFLLVHDIQPLGTNMAENPRSEEINLATPPLMSIQQLCSFV